jgi:PAS domain S-box-containing protein
VELHNIVQTGDREQARILGGLQDALYCIDAASGEYTFVNPAFESLTGYTLDEIRSLGGRIAFGDRTRTSMVGSAAFTGRESAPALPSLNDEERWFRRKDGTILCLEDRCGPMTENGVVVAYTGILRDVTDRKIWEGETLERLTLLRTVVDSLPDIIYAKDRQGRKLMSNAAELRELLQGANEEEVLGKDDFAFFSVDLAKEFTRLDQQVLQTGVPLINHEVSIEDQTGVIHYLLSTKVPFKDADGKVAGLVGIARDITDRHNANESLRLFRALVDHSNDSIVVIDPGTGQFIDANETALKALGYTRTEFMTKTMFDIDATTNQKAFARLIADLQKTGGTVVRRKERRRDGTVFPSEVSLNLVHVDRDYIVAAIRDITKRMEAEEALRKSEERFRLVSENVADLLAILDTEGVCEFASPSHLQDGYLPHALINKNYLALIHGDDVALVRERMARVAEGMGHQSIEFRFRRADGSWRYKDASFTLIVDDAGERLLIIARDITDRKAQDEQRQSLERQLSDRNADLEKTITEFRQMQEGLIQSEKMASIGQLTAGIAHEINNPLAFVSSNLNRFGEYFNDVVGVLKVWDVVKEDLAKDPQFMPLMLMVKQAEEKADVEFAVQNFPMLMTHTSEGTERIRSIVDRLRGFSHMATSSFAEADINAALDDTINLTWNELKYKATIVKEYGEVPRVSCNVGEIKQVLVNLIVNAAQALKDKGTITLRTSSEDGTLLVQVIDSGSGIPEAHLKRIFDPFFTTKAVGKGTGLGLWISATIVQKHGGALMVDSVEGKGTTMTIALPLTREISPEEVK